MATSEYTDLVKAIEGYNQRCLADPNCQTMYDMKWSVDVSIKDEDAGADIRYFADIHFLTWAGYYQGVTFYKQTSTDEDKILVTDQVTVELIMSKLTEFFWTK